MEAIKVEAGSLLQTLAGYLRNATPVELPDVELPDVVVGAALFSEAVAAAAPSAARPPSPVEPPLRRTNSQLSAMVSSGVPSANDGPYSVPYYPCW